MGSYWSALVILLERWNLRQRTGTGSCNHGALPWLISKKGNDNRGSTMSKTTGGRTSSAVVTYGTHSIIAEQPFVRDVALRSASGMNSHHISSDSPIMKTLSDTSAEEILDQPADTRARTPALSMAPRIVRVKALTSSTTMEPNLRISMYVALMMTRTQCKSASARLLGRPQGQPVVDNLDLPRNSSQ